jgi:hypothetical protein
MKKAILLSLIFALLLSAASYADEMKWYMGNIHCHTINSDGRSSAEKVIKWYQKNLYNFIAITDHNKLTVVDRIPESRSPFLLIPGEEVTNSFNKKPIHTVALNIKSLVKPQRGSSMEDILQKDINAINEAGGIAQINHPHWKWSFDANSLEKITGAVLLEVINANLDTNNYSAGGVPGTEEMWDQLLSKGKLIYGSATDDAHVFEGDFSRYHCNPGNGWIMVKAPELTADSIISSIRKGMFYATTGALLKDITVNEHEYSVEVAPMRDCRFTIFFIGKDGKILKKENGMKSKYEFKGGELYVRAKIIATSGEFALTQPAFLKDLRKK